MGAGQSKQPQPPPQASSSSADDAAPPSAAPAVSSSQNPPANDNAAASKGNESSSEKGGCPMKNADGSYRIMPGFASLFGRMGGHPPVDAEKVQAANAAAAGESAADASKGKDGDGAPAQQQGSGSGGGCPVKLDGASSSSWNILRRGQSSDTSNRRGAQQQYDVYSRPLPMDPTNNMPVVNPTTAARNSLPAPNQSVALPTERVSSSIPKGGAESDTWTYPSPQMFYNALARKGKLDADTKEEDMVSVVAIHNCMNEGTWERILQWEKVLNKDADNSNGDGGEGGEGGSAGPSLTKFMGRPTDLSPKAFFKHYLLSHPLPFDRHDWTVTRSNSDGSTKDVRYVIDYYHDDAAAKEEDGSGLPEMDEGIGKGGRIQSLLVDVRPAADGPSEIWGRMVKMPLARRGCRSMLECLLFKGHGSGRKSEFEPLPLKPSESLKESLGESQVVWDNIQKDAAAKKGVGAKDEACASDSLEGEKVKDVVGAAESGRKSIDQTDLDAAKTITKEEATKLAKTYSQILSECKEAKEALKSCSSEEECNKAYTSMTVCAGKYMCPLQHSSLLDSLESHNNAENEEMAEAKINTALDVLGECVANFDGRAGMARREFPGVFEEVLKGGKK